MSGLCILGPRPDSRPTSPARVLSVPSDDYDKRRGGSVSESTRGREKGAGLASGWPLHTWTRHVQAKRSASLARQQIQTAATPPRRDLPRAAAHVWRTYRSLQDSPSCFQTEQGDLRVSRENHNQP